MARGGQKSCPGGGDIFQRGEIFSRTQEPINSPPPLANFSSTPLLPKKCWLVMSAIFMSQKQVFFYASKNINNIKLFFLYVLTFKNNIYINYFQWFTPDHKLLSPAFSWGYKYRTCHQLRECQSIENNFLYSKIIIHLMYVYDLCILYPL